MKTAIIIAALAVVEMCAAYGQGQFFFNAHDTTAGNVLSFTLNGTPATGNDLFVEVLAGSDALHMSPLTPLLALDRTGAGAGLPNPFSATYTVPGMTARETATVGILGFEGTTPAAATASSGPQALGTVVLTEPPTPPNEVAIGTHSIDIVTPEPNTWILLIIGAVGIVILGRRRTEFA